MTYPELLLEKEKWSGPLEALTAGVVTMIQKFGDTVDEDVGMGASNKA